MIENNQLIEGDKIFLRPITMSDTENIVKWRNQEDVRSRFIYQEDFTRESHINWMETKVKTGEVVQMMICEKESKRAIGSAYFRDIDRIHNKAEYGLFIGESDCRIKGIGFEVTSLMLNYGFSVLKLHRIIGRVLSDNVISLKSAIKAGMIQEGLCIDDVCINGCYKDVYMLAAINHNEE